MNAVEFDRLIAGFLACSLARAEWTHHAHLRVGLWHVKQFGADEALIRLRAGICRLNESFGNANTDSGGYHETITRFYVQVLVRFLETSAAEVALPDLAEAFIACHPHSSLPLEFFSRELLFSVRARREWVEPDLKPLPSRVRGEYVRG